MALTTAFHQDHPVAVRYPRGAGVGATVDKALNAWPWGQGVVRREGQRLAILAFGTLLHAALRAAESLNATVVDMRFVKPLDEALVLKLAQSHEAFITVEEGCVMGGAGSAVGECLAANGLALPLLQLGLPDAFVEHGDHGQLLALCGLDAAGIEQSIRKRFLPPGAQRPTLAVA
jgi:1-deoxy-D-xylulose-5-phosphate synthase